MNKRPYLWQIISIVIIFLMLGINSISAFSVEYSAFSEDTIYVDDDFNSSTPGWGIDHFDNIQDGVDNVSDGGSVYIYQGIYGIFTIYGRSDLLISAIDGHSVLVEGNQQAWDVTLTTPVFVKCVIFVDNSEEIQLNNLNVQGSGLSGRSYAIYYNDSTGSINECIVSPNERGNMNSIAIRAHINSNLIVENCIIENYGRIGIYCRTGTHLEVYNCELIGQEYSISDGDYVSYGIEVEDLSIASSAIIRNNEIYNHLYDGDPSWSSAGIIVDAWRYYQQNDANCSAVIEYNDIHDNMIGVQIVPNENIHVNRNKIYDNTDFGAVSDPYTDGSGYVNYPLNAEYNWWGDTTGPYQEIENPDGLGNEITDYVIFTPWAENIGPIISLTKPEKGYLYINLKDVLDIKFLFFINIVIGKIDIEAETSPSLYEIDRVELYIDDELTQVFTNEPYRRTWDQPGPVTEYNIKVIVYDTEGNDSSDEVDVWRILI